MKDSALTSERPCQRCGHAEREHMHYRRGTDCSRRGCLCGEFVGSRVQAAVIRFAAKVRARELV